MADGGGGAGRIRVGPETGCAGSDSREREARGAGRRTIRAAEECRVVGGQGGLRSGAKRDDSGVLLSGAKRHELFEQQRQRAQGELSKQLDELNNAADGAVTPSQPEDPGQ